MMIRKPLLRMLAILSLGAVGLIVAAYSAIGVGACGKIYTQVADCPANDIGILFGCAKIVNQGRRNLYYIYRIRAAADLYAAGKVKHLLVSGDNHIKSYNEPETMQRDLMAAGVPKVAITLDYAGFSTFETLTRARQIFGVRSATLITQPSHLPRALYLAQHEGIVAVGYSATEPTGQNAARVKLREVAARFGMYGDLYLWGRQPKFLGKQEFIVIQSP